MPYYNYILFVKNALFKTHLDKIKNNHRCTKSSQELVEMLTSSWAERIGTVNWTKH